MSAATEDRTTIRVVIERSKAVFTPLALAFLTYFFWINRHTLISIYSEGRVANFFLVILCWIGLHCVSPLFTRLALQSLGLSIDYRTALRIHVSRLPAKYLPGGVWHSVARAADYRITGMESAQVIRYLVLENLVIVAVALGIGSAFALQAAASLYVGFVIAVIMLAAWLLVFLLPRMSRLRVVSGSSLSALNYFQSVLVMVFYWCLAGVSFSLFVTALPGLHIATSAVIAGGIYVFSWGVGYLAVFAPQGLGVAEAVSGLLLGGKMELGGVIIALLGFRLLMALADIASWLLYSLFFRRARK